MPDLTRQIAIVCGASGGVGEVIAGALAQQGVLLVLVGRNPKKLKSVAETLCSASPRVECVSTDLTREDEIDALVGRVEHDFGRLDILIHSAGIYDDGKIEETPIASLDDQLKTNVRSPFRLTQQLLPLLRKPRGQIVFISSSAALAARGEKGFYSAAQHARRALANTLRDEVNKDGIRVLNVFLGRTATPLMQALYAKEARRYDPDVLLQPGDVATVVVHALSLPWTAELTELSLRPMKKSY